MPTLRCPVVSCVAGTVRVHLAGASAHIAQSRDESARRRRLEVDGLLTTTTNFFTRTTQSALGGSLEMWKTIAVAIERARRASRRRSRVVDVTITVVMTITASVPKTARRRRGNFPSTSPPRGQRQRHLNKFIRRRRRSVDEKSVTTTTTASSRRVSVSGPSCGS